MFDTRTAYRRATRRIRAGSIPANSAAAWRIICEEFGVDPSEHWGDIRALNVQSHLQSVSYPQGLLHHRLAHRVLNFPSLIRNYERARRASELSASMRHKGKLQTLAGGYVALPGDDSETRQNEWRERGRVFD